MKNKQEHQPLCYFQRDDQFSSNLAEFQVFRRRRVKVAVLPSLVFGRTQSRGRDLNIPGGEISANPSSASEIKQRFSTGAILVVPRGHVACLETAGLSQLGQGVLPHPVGRGLQCPEQHPPNKDSSGSKCQ